MRWFVTTRGGIIWFRAPTKKAALDFAIDRLNYFKHTYAYLYVMSEEDYKNKNRDNVIKVSRHGEVEDREYEKKKQTYLKDLIMAR